MEERQSLKSYMDEYCLSMDVINDALLNGIVDYDGDKQTNLGLVWYKGHWCFENLNVMVALCEYNHKWNSLKAVKTYAEMECGKLGCVGCPLKHLDCRSGAGHTVQTALDETNLDREERAFYQKRIDRCYQGED